MFTMLWFFLYSEGQEAASSTAHCYLLPKYTSSSLILVKGIPGKEH